MSKNLVLIRNITINFLSIFLVFITAFITTPIILSHLGVTKYGVLIVITTVIGLLASFDFGYSQAFVQAYSVRLGRDKQVSSLFYSTLTLFILFGLIWGLVAFFATPFLVVRVLSVSEQYHSISVFGLRTFSFILPLLFIETFLSLPFVAREEFHLARTPQILIGIFIPLGTVFVLLLNMGLKELFIFYLIFHFSITLFLVWLVFSRLKLKFKLFITLGTISSLTKYARWKFVSNISGQFRQRFSVLYITNKLSVTSVPFFSIAQGLAEKYMGLLPNITSPIFSRIAILKGERKKHEIKELFKSSTKLVNLLLLPGALFLFIYTQSFLELWIGEEFAFKSTPILKALLIGVILSIQNGIPMAFLEALGYPKITAIFSVSIVFGFITLSVILIQSYGLFGAAIAYIVVYAIQVPILIVYSSKKILGKLNWNLIFKSYFIPITITTVTIYLFHLLVNNPSNWSSLFLSLLSYLGIISVLYLSFKIVKLVEIKNVFINFFNKPQSS